MYRVAVVHKAGEARISCIKIYYVSNPFPLVYLWFSVVDSSPYASKVDENVMAMLMFLQSIMALAISNDKKPRAEIFIRSNSYTRAKNRLAHILGNWA